MTALKPTHWLRSVCHQLARTGKWGTCSGCPRREGLHYPEECQFKDRYDHDLDPQSAAEQIFHKSWSPNETLGICQS